LICKCIELMLRIKTILMD